MSRFRQLPASRDDCVLHEEFLFVEARELVFRLWTLVHSMIPLEQHEKFITPIRKRAERVAHKADMRLVRRQTAMLRARMWSGVHVFDDTSLQANNTQEGQSAPTLE